MKTRISLLVCFICLFAPSLYSQTMQVDWPVSRMVFQRSTNNTAVVPVRGRLQGSASRVVGRLVARQGGQTTEWREATLQDGLFQVNIQAIGGFYDLELMTLNGTRELTRQRQERIGVGEVFVIAGQSNNYGEPGKGLPATDDRVSVLNHWPGNDGFLDENAMPMSFAQAGAGTFCGPRNPLYIWGGLGDRLVARLGVPVLFLGAAHPGSSTNNWREAAQGVERVTGRNWTDNLPYRPLRLTLQHYARQLGVRSILWHQGESDNFYQTTDGYVQNMRILIDKTRQDSQYNNLSWTIARASYYPFYPGHELDPAIIAGQNAVISNTSNCFPGPETDAFIGPKYREDQIHFSDFVYGFLADLWSQSMTTDYFQRSQPSLPQLGAPSPQANLDPTPVVVTDNATSTPNPPTSTVVETPVTRGPLQMAAPSYNCQTGVLSFRLASEPGTGNTIEYMAPGITVWTTNPTHTLGAGLRRDAQTLTLFARQAGQVTSLVWNLREFCNAQSSSPVSPAPANPTSTQPTTPTGTTAPPPPGAFALLNPAYECQTGVITFSATVGNGSPVEFMAPGVTVWTSNPTHTLGAGLRRDARTITIFARQSGLQTSLVWNLREACTNDPSARVSLSEAPPIDGLVPTPNPTTDLAQLEWPDILKVNWTSRVLDLSGLEMPATITPTAKGLQVDLRRVRTGLYIWQVIPPGRPAQAFRIMKVN